ncbi:hypothetical protein EDI_313320 [Entamoeba dispar SAW760]|uniref:Uncharacterized protein n=1 Tax=Entamoeba dispar (strain ATCC PRA-260 / SAW760) TaxID=370354 RepID=B0ELN9_ENTDS|nr:uncharacterized protein EDI_313320 [Entamoeba dispar SAW760]EDR24570.1 hypothetical protein EDI_313320 [Entamoeba dispar SAW760]|eukprot:EDR24570.1 hypothetical protein EDI_313320 [Entamoeba dispar SAW760]
MQVEKVIGIEVDYNKIMVCCYDGKEHEMVEFNGKKYLTPIVEFEDDIIIGREKNDSAVNGTVIEEVIGNGCDIEFLEEEVCGQHVTLKPEIKLALIFEKCLSEIQKKERVKKIIICVPNETHDGSKRRIEVAAKLGGMKNFEVVRKVVSLFSIIKIDNNLEINARPFIIVETKGEEIYISYGLVNRKNNKKIIGILENKIISNENQEKVKQEIIGMIALSQREYSENKIISFFGNTYGITSEEIKKHGINDFEIKKHEIDEELYCKAAAMIPENNIEEDELLQQREVIKKINSLNTTAEQQNNENVNNIKRMKLGCNEIMTTSMYFNDIKDFINLEIGIKRFQGNMERFHFNPIPLNEHSRKFFPNIETFYIYIISDEEFDDGRINKKIIWDKVNYLTYLQEKEAGNICKNIEYTKEDRNKYGTIIPSEVKSLGDECFKDCTTLTSITIPPSIRKIGNRCFYGCSSLKHIKPQLMPVIEMGKSCFYGCGCEEELRQMEGIPENCFSK